MPAFSSQRVRLGCAVLCALGCDGDGALAPRIELPVDVDSRGLGAHRNDLGYEIVLDRCRVAVEHLEFTTEGEAHARILSQALELFVPPAHAHPGHDAGGEVVGELAGSYVFDWREDGLELGLATMLHASYSGANFTFGRAAATSGVSPDDPLFGHTFHLEGTATLDGATTSFEVVLDQDEGRRVIGLPMALDVDDETTATLGLALHLVDPVEGGSAFDGIHFAALAADPDGVVRLGPDEDAHHLLRRRLQTHDHYRIERR